MKKVLIGFIFVLCLVGGVAIGKIRQQKGKIPGGLVMDATASPESSPAELAAADATATDAMATESPTDAAASETPADSTVASASDTGSSSSSDSSSSSMDTAMASSTPEVASDATAISGRSFGTGSSSRKSRTSSGSSSSSGSGSSSSSSSASSSAIADSSFSAPTPRKARASGTPIPDNQVIDVSTPSDDLGAGSESSFDVPPPTSGKKSKTAPAIASSELDDLPTIDDGGTSPDPFEAGSASAAPTPDPFANAVAMAPPSGGGGELNFPSGSGRSLKKVSQKQSGASTVVRIDMSGSAKYRVYKTRAGKVFIDIEETDVPGGASPTVAGSGQVKEISAKPVTNAGGMKLARVQLLVNVTGEKLPNISAETSGNAITVTIGGAASEF